MQTVSVLVPIPITDAMLSSSSIAEPDATQGEVSWAAATRYFTGDFAVRATTHKSYACFKDESAARSQLPENDPFYWEAWKPTNKWAPFDGTSSTQAIAATSLSYTVTPGFFNAVCFYGLLGATMHMVVKDAPGGTIIFDQTYNIQQVPFDEYDYCWGQIIQRDRLVVDDITPYPNAELTITITGSTSGVGTIAIGDLCSLVPQDATWAGPNYGASAKPTSFSDPQVLSDGTVRYDNGRSATDLVMDLQVPLGGGDIALAILQRVLNVPACWIGTGAEGYSGLNTFGVASAEVDYEDGFEFVRIDVTGRA